MKREIRITEDGSHTLYVKELNEHYHSIHGAIAESQHIFIDAFAPDVQPELWSTEIFKKIYDLTTKEGILTTYSVKGDVRRSLMAAGFSVEKIPGPRGKRERMRGAGEMGMILGN